LRKPVLVDPGVWTRLEALDTASLSLCVTALRKLSIGFGDPHLHAGLGIRKLGRDTFECRAGLALRFVFMQRPDCLWVVLLGDHNEVARAMRNRR
jgi:hypothetical protein